MQPEVATARCGQRPEHFKSHHKENNILDVYHVAVNVNVLTAAIPPRVRPISINRHHVVDNVTVLIVIANITMD